MMNNLLKKSILTVLLFWVLWIVFFAESDEFPSVLSIRDRVDVVNKITKMRLDRLLSRFMRETGFDMWLIVCNQDNYDPVFLTMVPYNAGLPLDQILVFHDEGPDKGVKRMNISRTRMPDLHESVWKASHTDPNLKEGQWECLARIVKNRDAKRIGINVSDVIWAADGLSVSNMKKLKELLGPDYSRRFHSAEELSTLWLETLLEEELDLFSSAVSISRALIAETFSNDTITPGVTTTDDLVYYYWQRISDIGISRTFKPSFSIRARYPDMVKKYGKKDRVIRRGDLLHCDVGLRYLRYCTDTQEMAYVLRRGETEVPEGLKRGLAEGNRLQDIFCSEMKEGLKGNQMLNNMLKRAKMEGIEKPRIYSHSLGLYSHEPGPLIGLPWEQVNTGPRGEVKLVHNSGFTVELSVDLPVPEWGGEVVRFKLEQDVVFTRKGVFHLGGRQTEYHIIR